MSDDKKDSVQMKLSIPGTGPAEGQGIGNLGTMVPAQDYSKIRRQCIQSKRLFEDPYFPADNRSLFFSTKLPFTPEWKRPHELVSKPKMFTGGADRFDVKQGMLGDCWLVAAIASLTQDKILLSKVIPGDQDFDRGYAGVFRFRFWHFGEYVDIVIDDKLPTKDGKLIFIHSEDPNEFWSALLEKAYAKLYGGFEALKGGKTSEAMTDFTGGVVEHFELSKAPDNLFLQMLKNSKHSSLMSCSIKTTSRTEVEAKLDNGLVKGHAYSITGVATVSVRGDTEQLVRIRNPWGQKEWNGDWGDTSDKWKLISASDKERLQADFGEDGEFWMSFDDFKKHFTDIEMCSVSIDALYEDEKNKSWTSVIINGSWEGDKAGGCRNFPTFTNNTQYAIDLKEDADGDGKCSVLIALMQKHRRKQKKMGVQDLVVGFSVYKAPAADTVKLDKKFVDYNRSTGTSGSFTNAREVMQRFDLEPGRYIIIPCVFKPSEEGDYLLRIFTESAGEDEKEAAVAASPVQSKSYEMFKQIAGADGEIDAEELQELLTATYCKGSGIPFSMEACRSLVAMIDTDHSGSLNFKEFVELMKKIKLWKAAFFKYDKDRSGTLEKNEVFYAVKSLIDISPMVCNALFYRFAKKGKYMSLDDFIACMSRLTMMHDSFNKISAGSGKAQFSRDEFYTITLAA